MKNLKKCINFFISYKLTFTELGQHFLQFTSKYFSRIGFGDGVQEDYSALKLFMWSNFSVDKVSNIFLRYRDAAFLDNVSTGKFPSHIVWNTNDGHV